MPEEKAAASAGVETIELSDLDVLLKDNFNPKTDKAASAVQSAVATLASQALANTALVSDDAVKSIEGMIAEIDRKLSEQLNQVLHHDDFQKMEGSWRGLHHLVFNTETDETLKIKVLNIKKKELTKTFKKFSGAAWDQSPLFKQVYEHEFGTANGEPYGCLVGDFYFDHSAPDVEILKGMGQIAAAAHAPFVTGTAPSLMNMDSWEELDNPRDLTKIFQSPDYAAWRSFRETEDSKYITMTMPRFMSRLPYGAKSSPVDEFAFEEEFNGGEHNKYV
ncbi:MAG: type VI secretion system contractile sheath large subunit, partial [Lentisphaeraceae bacterium]|nr:type VI secretion system contractile sheath large subunit [Lentisphaeraceae bacterium]